jgi:hypothetical protein
MIRIRWIGLSETPSNRKKLLEGLCVGLFVRYSSYTVSTEGALKIENGSNLIAMQ